VVDADCILLSEGDYGSVSLVRTLNFRPYFYAGALVLGRAQ
jgi:hypothetical protein